MKTTDEILVANFEKDGETFCLAMPLNEIKTLAEVVMRRLESGWKVAYLEKRNAVFFSKQEIQAAEASGNPSPDDFLVNVGLLCQQTTEKNSTGKD